MGVIFTGTSPYTTFDGFDESNPYKKIQEEEAG